MLGLVGERGPSFLRFACAGGDLTGLFGVGDFGPSSLDDMDGSGGDLMSDLDDIRLFLILAQQVICMNIKLTAECT